MKKLSFSALNKKLKEYSRVQGEYLMSRNDLRDTLMPLVISAIKSEVAKPKLGYASEDAIISHISSAVCDYYLDPELKLRLPKGRLRHDGHIVFAINGDLMIRECIAWGIACEQIKLYNPPHSDPNLVPRGYVLTR